MNFRGKWRNTERSRGARHPFSSSACGSFFEKRRKILQPVAFSCLTWAQQRLLEAGRVSIF